MARTPRSKKPKLDSLDGVTDPRAPLDSAALLAASRPLLARLEADLLARAAASPAVSHALAERHAEERAAERTADSLPAWTAALATQVAAAWLLSCVFVRTLEDRGLLRQARLAGPGALDSQRLFLQLAPSLTERDYLLTVFRELAHHPAARDLFDAEHSLVWKLSPSAALAKELLALFRTPSADAPAFRFGQSSTRFLGDLYQDLSEDVRKRYALLQTPDFVESFILDRTLEPALERFGLDDTTVIDPTCGSGHFLLGAFDRLFEHRLRAEPGIDPRRAATRALDAVYGADINPYAVAIARFRLTLSYLDKAGYSKLADAPALPLHLVVADSLLHRPEGAQRELASVTGQSVGAWGGSLFAVEDEAAAKDVLHRRYAAVVGNPPYITEKDPAKREVYRRMYVSAAGKYALSAPFCERFFQLARDRGYVGQITANSFMKREFGKRLVEDFLPTVNLALIVNTSGAYIPGHGTPTVLLFGTTEPPVDKDVLAVLAKRGEPSTPDNPAEGLVWTSIVDHWREVGFENDYLSIARVDRTTLAKHPWSLGGGGVAELKELLEERAEKRLSDITDSIGIASFTLEDEVFLRPRPAWLQSGCPSNRLRDMVIGEAIRDWTVGEVDAAFFPYDEDFAPMSPHAPELSLLWPWRSVLANNKLFGGKTKVEGGLQWFEYGRLTADKLRTPLTITFAFVATHNHFVLDRGGKVFKQSAPIIKLPASATEDDHLALLAYLNSSAACFWMKQVMMNKGATSDRGVLQADEDKFRFEFDGTKIRLLPLPRDVHRERLVELARQLTEAGAAISGAYLDTLIESPELRLGEQWERIERARARTLTQMVAWQEEIDWLVYDAFGLVGDDAALWSTRDVAPMTADERAFACSAPRTDVDQRRREALSTFDAVRMIETSEFKRRWYRSQGKFNAAAVDDAYYRQAATERAALDALEKLLREDAAPASERWIAAGALANVKPLDEAIRLTAGSSTEPTQWLESLIGAEAVPYLAAYRYTEEGLEKYAQWLATWDAQRAEDRGERVDVRVPPKYAGEDFQHHDYFRLRGKLDVPKERFISYPGCESDQDGEHVYGWAGWDHLQRALALAQLYMKRKNDEGWPKERLTPMLAGLHELLPWLHQWHSAPSDDYGGQAPSAYFTDFLSAELRHHSLTPSDLLSWRPPKKAARRATAGKRSESSGGVSRDDTGPGSAKVRNRRTKVTSSDV